MVMCCSFTRYHGFSGLLFTDLIWAVVRVGYLVRMDLSPSLKSLYSERLGYARDLLLRNLRAIAMGSLRRIPRVRSASVKGGKA